MLTQIWLMKGFPGDIMYPWGSPLKPKAVPRTQVSSTPQVHPTWTHMLEDIGDWGAEVLGVIAGDKGGYNI